MAHHQSIVDRDAWVSGWRCPVCNASDYWPVIVTKPNGESYRTEFWQCGRCTLVFMLPGQFTRLGVPLRRWAGDIYPKSLAEVHRLAMAPRKWPRDRRCASLWIRPPGARFRNRA